jgi:hypothetical protein
VTIQANDVRLYAEALFARVGQKEYAATWWNGHSDDCGGKPKLVAVEQPEIVMIAAEKAQDRIRDKQHEDAARTAQRDQQATDAKLKTA